MLFSVHRVINVDKSITLILSRLYLISYKSSYFLIAKLFYELIFFHPKYHCQIPPPQYNSTLFFPIAKTKVKFFSKNIWAIPSGHLQIKFSLFSMFINDKKSPEIKHDHIADFVFSRIRNLSGVCTGWSRKKSTIAFFDYKMAENWAISQYTKVYWITNNLLLMNTIHFCFEQNHCQGEEN